MRRFARSVLLVRGAAIGLAAAALPGAAHAATTIGSVSQAYTGSSERGTPAVISQGGLQAVAPTSGVITSVSTRLSAGTATVALLRGSAASGPTVVGAVPVTGAAGSPVVTSPARFRVQFGDRLALGLNGTGQVRFRGVVGGPSVTIFDQSLPVAGAALVTGTDSTVSSTEIALSAVLERDADADGYGDETQDSCPGLPTVHAGLCVADLRTTPGTDQTMIAGGAAVLSATVGNLSDAPSRGASVAVALPAGVELVALTATGGTCTGVSCSLGTLTGPASATVFAIVRGLEPGSYPVRFSATTTDPISNPGDDTATALLTVTPPPPSTAPPAAPTSPAPLSEPVRLCAVPKLRGLTRAAASTRLVAAGCQLGRVSGPKRRRARVRSQTIPAGVQVLAGTRVAIRVR